MSKSVGARIENPEVWDKFVNFVIQRHGKKHTVMGIELENALRSYMDSNFKTHTQKKSKSEKQLEEYRTYLKSRNVNIANISEKGIKEMMQTFSKQEYRAIDRYFDLLCHENFFKGEIIKNPPKKSKRKSKNIYYF